MSSPFDEAIPFTAAPKRDRALLRATARAKAHAGHNAHMRRLERDLAPREEDLVQWGDHVDMEEPVVVLLGRPEPVVQVEAVTEVHTDFDDMFLAKDDQEERDEPDLEYILGTAKPPSHFGLILVAAVLGGLLGIDRFISRRYWLGTFKLLTLGGLGVWALWDIASILCGTYTTGSGTTLSGTRKERIIAAAGTGTVLLLVGALLVPQIASGVSLMADKPVVEEARAEKVLELRSLDPDLQSLDLPITGNITLTAMATSGGEGALVATAPDRTTSSHPLVGGQSKIDIEVREGVWNLKLDCPESCSIDVYSPPAATP